MAICDTTIVVQALPIIPTITLTILLNDRDPEGGADLNHGVQERGIEVVVKLLTTSFAHCGNGRLRLQTQMTTNCTELPPCRSCRLEARIPGGGSSSKTLNWHLIGYEPCNLTKDFLEVPVVHDLGDYINITVIRSRESLKMIVVRTTDHIV